MKPFRVLAVLAAALLLPLLAACGGTASSASTATPAASESPIGAKPSGGADLAGTSWVLSGGIGAGADLSASGIDLEFADKDLAGSAGVNRYFGSYTSTSDGTLTIGTIGSTMMAGDEAKMALETEYLTALQSVFGYTVTGDTLELFGAADQVLTYTKK